MTSVAPTKHLGRFHHEPVFGDRSTYLARMGATKAVTHSEVTMFFFGPVRKLCRNMLVLRDILSKVGAPPNKLGA